MPIASEIEGKWLIASAPDLKRKKGIPISQGYLVVTPSEEVRLRRMGVRCFLTLKSGNGLIRKETEIPLSAKQFISLWPSTSGKRVIKTRYSVPVGAFLAEVDVYSGANKGLKCVEVEFRSAAEYKCFVPPAWFGKNVTNDPKFKNKNLALNPLKPS